MHGDNLAFWEPTPAWVPAPDPCVVVTLPGGVELLADPARSQAEYTLAGWSGWDEGTEPRGGVVPWPIADGGIEGDVHYSGRNLEFHGLIVGQSPQHYWELRERLGSVLADTRWGLLTVDEDHLGLSRQVRVARGGRATFGTPMSDRVGTYQIQFQSATHLRVAVDLQTAALTTGGVTAANVGSASASVTAVLRGPLTNPGISWPGGAWQYSGTVASGQRLNVFMDERRIQDPATTTQYRRNASGSWLSLPPGETVVSRTGTGGGSVTLEWRSSWA